jgi:hypothetical protein
MRVSWVLHQSALLLAGVPAVLSLPHTTITAPDSIPAQASSPAHCRVAATLKPSTGSDIKIEVWLPATWSGGYDQ